MERFSWSRLPEPARCAFEAEFGRVRAVTTTPPGLSVGIASRVEAEHATVFVKALPLRSPALPDLEREHAVARVLPTAVPAPRLRWSSRGSWLALAFDHIDGRHVDLSRDATAVMAALSAMCEVLRPAPLAGLRPIGEKFGAMLDAARAGAHHPAERSAEAAAFRAVLEGADLEGFAGDSLLHADPAVSNLLTDGTGVYLVDWALTSRGAAWVDAALLIPGLIRAGHSPARAEAWARTHPDWDAAPAAALDLLAVLRPLFLLDKIRSGPAWLAEQRRAALPAYRAWARHRLGLASE